MVLILSKRVMIPYCLEFKLDVKLRLVSQYVTERLDQLSVKSVKLNVFSAKGKFTPADGKHVAKHCMKNCSL